ncbi:MAG: hypothetical protein C0510_11635 [Erythrobacter sp.]|nr:hypothetical protein [Erythrobacter sp.]
MRLFFFAPLAALVCLAASPARAADDAPVILEPSSQWVVDFAEDKCRLLRTFGEEGNRHVLIFEQGWPSSSFEFTAAGPEFEQFDTSMVTTHFGGFLPVETMQQFLGTNKGFGAAIIYPSLWFAPNDQKDEEPGSTRHSLPQIDPVQASKIDSVSIQQGKKEVIFRTGELSEATNVLNQCAQDLLNSWGLDLDRHRSAVRLPIALNERRVMDAVFPEIAERVARNVEQGAIRLRLIVDETGKVIECRQVYATMPQSFEVVACKGMKRARYKPALDNEGHPMRSYYIFSLSFR